jgi:3-deoxy-D-manno-octulosonate 8-phosphate phosphatase KdsC-like HAD superfamily phosphatase
MNSDIKLIVMDVDGTLTDGGHGVIHEFIHNYLLA